MSKKEEFILSFVAQKGGKVFEDFATKVLLLNKKRNLKLYLSKEKEFLNKLWYIHQSLSVSHKKGGE